MNLRLSSSNEQTDFAIKFILLIVSAVFASSLIQYFDEGNWRNYSSYFDFLITDAFNPGSSASGHIGIGLILFFPVMLALFGLMRYGFRIRSWIAFALSVLLFPVAVVLFVLVVMSIFWGAGKLIEFF